MLENFLEESLVTALMYVALFGKLVRTSVGVWELLIYNSICSKATFLSVLVILHYCCCFHDKTP